MFNFGNRNTAAMVAFLMFSGIANAADVCPGAWQD